MTSREPLARCRLYALWFALAAALYTLVLIRRNGATTPAHAIIGSVSTVLLAGWWCWGYRRQDFPAASFVPEALLLVAAGSAAGAPQDGLGLFLGAYQFRGLYVPRRQLAWLVVIFAAARLGAMGLASGVATYTPLSLQSAATIAMFGFVAVMWHLLADGMTRQAAAEIALRRNDERYRLVAGATHDVIYDWRVSTGIVDCTEAMRTVFGYASETIGSDLAWWMERVHPDDRSRLNAAMTGPMTGKGAATAAFRFRFRRADGRYAMVSATGLVQRDAKGMPVRVIGSLRDITAEQRLEDDLRQALKMEAVGQLAGGVAHDFNNLLTVIGGHVYLLRQRLPGNEVAARQLDGIAHAANRGAALTKQLLAFSRKQVLVPSRVDVNDVITNTTEMIRRLIGENIRLATNLSFHMEPILADEGQLGQLLITLAVNARDAMPNGGTLTIETGGVTLPLDGAEASATTLSAGAYARIVVRDTGIGMDATTQARAFEPFFTTKEPGKGTGLGLSTVYGIIKQSAGDIWIESAPGSGAAFTILLPIAPPVTGEVEPHEPRAVPERGVSAAPERILLVEDDEGVREFASGVLTQAGYHVIAARNGVEGLAIAKQHHYALDGVVTDVVMPEMGGRAMVEQLRISLPGVRVLYMSGYTDDMQMLGEIRASDAALLEKPFTAEALTLALGGVQPGLPVS